MFAKKLFARSRSVQSRRSLRRIGRLESLEDRRMFNVDYHGGPVISNVEVEPIFCGSGWSSDASLTSDAQQLSQYFSYLTQSSYMDLLTQYGAAGQAIGHGMKLPSMGLNVSLPPGTVVDDSEFQSALDGWIADGSVARPNANELFFFFTPPDVEVTMDGGNSHNTFLGYHHSFTDLFGDRVRYAVIPDPIGNADMNGMTAFQQQTVVSSHELSEAVTDPDGNGWYDASGDARPDQDTHILSSRPDQGQTKTPTFYQAALGESNLAKTSVAPQRIVEAS